MSPPATSAAPCWSAARRESPVCRERVAQEFGIEPDAYVDVDLSVALGAAMQSALDHALSAAQIVVDIAPHALGIAAAESWMAR